MPVSTSFPTSHDLFFLESSINGGNPVGFMLARPKLAHVGVRGAVPSEPYLQWLPWFLDPAKPEDPTAGHYGVRQWRLKLAALNSLIYLTGSREAFTAQEIRGFLLAFSLQSKFTLYDVDQATYAARMTGYAERHIEP